ncbi:MAG TPA: restriction endonuclease subunit S [Pseudomonas sabulinigri]|uniref:Type I restriction modification DNA specificity domain-containing protein n=1 Tax=marine sediment metagenome TaxID=412755 RepID=A0A0F9VDT0_9ZZZZ|nr:restriction endonuclease subunit S [Halopseudomonas sabulinigri]HEC51141.1 restriction endonuclease subunit S [Halopseudomonas sabulinigri]
MTALLTDNLPLLAGAPNGIKKLRELILELAVRGKLLEQNSNDEAASELLTNIAKEKALLIENKTIRKGKPLPDIEQDEMQFKLPIGWEWVRLGQIGDWGAGATPARGNSSYYGGEMPWFKSGELIADFISDSEESVTELALKECSLRRNKPGDVLIAMYGATIGKTAILRVEGTTNQAVCACTPFNGVFNRYLLLTLKALKSNFIGQGAGGAQPNISREKIVATVTGLPPLAEQHRIVAKVDELMALCDRLEAQQADADSAHAQLVQALLDSLTQASDATDFATNWQRLAEHFHTLFTTEPSIDALKQTLLQLAVMGKLVPQDPNDESADKLLERISGHRLTYREKKHKSLADISEVEKPFKLPYQWAWTTLPAIGELARGKSRHRPRNDPSLYAGGNVPLIQTGDVARADGVVKTHSAMYNDKGVEQSRLWPAGTMCITIAANIADSATLGFDACFPDSVVGFIPEFPELDVRYFEFFLRTAKSHLEDFAPSTAQKNINLEILGLLSVPLPPANEVRRIIAKVDQLMALCDQLKKRLTKARKVNEQLASTLVEQAVA